jgi:hypothetical protein
MSALRAAVRAATMNPDRAFEVEFEADGSRVWVRSEAPSGFARLFTIRAVKGSRVLTRIHWSAADVEAFDFERVFSAGLR